MRLFVPTGRESVYMMLLRSRTISDLKNENFIARMINMGEKNINEGENVHTWNVLAMMV